MGQRKSCEQKGLSHENGAEDSCSDPTRYVRRRSHFHFYMEFFNLSVIIISTTLVYESWGVHVPNYIEYQKSVAAEFKAYANRVRNIIDDRHWGEEGRFKEIILMNHLKRVLPKHLSVGTGFVRNKDAITTQIDIIIYDNTFPLLFSEGDFIVAFPKNVIGIIEVKSKIISSDLKGFIEKANANAEIICGNSEKHLFNGIFSYSCKQRNETLVSAVKGLEYNSIIKKQHSNQICSNRLFSCVNHISFDSKRFIKLWPVGQMRENGGEQSPCYRLYNMENDLAIAYFISNLQEFVLRHSTGQYVEALPEELKNFFYPILGGKETQLCQEIKLGWADEGGKSPD